MLANINLRTLMLMTPIGFCTLLQFFSGSFFITQEEHYILKIIIPWLVSLGVAMILPNNNRIWMMTGTSLAYCVVINVLWHMQPNFQQSEILASFLGPLTSSILSPKTGHRKKNYKAFFVNYSLAIFFVIVLSLLLSICASFLYENIGSGINRAYLSSVYDSNFSFIYSMIYQFCQTFGFGQFITEIRAISPQDATSVSFYATTLAINISMIPAIYAAIFICQQRKRKTMYATLFTYYLILCLFFYFIGQYIDFNIYVNSQNFYQPNVLISEINIFDTKFLMFCTFIFIITVVSSTFLILQKKKNIHQTRTIKRVKQIKINVL